MRNRLQTSVRRWLRFEGHSADASSEEHRAEQALRQVFSRLPGIPVPTGFAERVLVRAGMAPVAAVRSPTWVPSFTVRLVLGFSLVLAAVSVVLLPGTLLWVGRLMEAFEPMKMATGALVAVSRRYGAGLAVWEVLVGVGQTAATALSTPKVLLALAASSLLSVAAFRLLVELMVGDRSSYHATSA